MSESNLHSQANLNQSTENNLNHHNTFLIIPSYVVDDPDIDEPTALLFGRLNALSNKEGYCWASNEYLSFLTKVSISEVKKRLQTLRRLDFIRMTLEKKGFNWDRKIYTCNHYHVWPKDKDPNEFKKIFTKDSYGADREIYTDPIEASNGSPEYHNHKKNKGNIIKEEASPPDTKQFLSSDDVINAKESIKKATSKMAARSKDMDEYSLSISFMKAGFKDNEIDICLDYYKTNLDFLLTKSNPIAYAITVMRKKLMPLRIIEDITQEPEKMEPTHSVKQDIYPLYLKCLEKKLSFPFRCTDAGVELNIDVNPTFVLYKLLDIAQVAFIKETLNNSLREETCV